MSVTLYTMEYLNFNIKLAVSNYRQGIFESFYYIVVMLLTYQHKKILMRAKPRALLVPSKCLRRCKCEWEDEERTPEDLFLVSF